MDHTKRWTIPNDGPYQTMDQTKRWTRSNETMDQIKRIFTYFHIPSSLDGNGGGGVFSDGRYQTIDDTKRLTIPNDGRDQTMDDGWIKYLTMDDHIPNDGRDQTMDDGWIKYQTMDRSNTRSNDGLDQTMDQIKRWTIKYQSSNFLLLLNFHSS